MTTVLRPVKRGGFDVREHMREALRASRAASQASTVDESFVQWASRVPEPQVGPLNLEDFPFQVEWYTDEIVNAEIVVWRKSSQVGLSAYAWRFGARQADVFGDTVIYTFPTDVHVRDFGDQRIEPAIEESIHLRSRIKAQWVHHKTAKRIGAGWLLLRGSNSRAGAQSAAAQTLIFDERDLLDEGNLEQMMRRVRGARAIGKRPKLRFFGNPTIPGYGIDEQYEASDKRKWLVTCGECDHEQEVTWEQNVRWTMPGSRKRWRAGADDPRVKSAELSREVVERVWRVCSRCDEPIDVRNGRWVATAPGSPIIGYHVTQLIVHGADLKALVVASRTSKLTALEAFFNNDLGVAWSPSEASLDQATLLRACERGGERQDGYTGAGAVTMGLDVASERDLNARIDLQLPAEGPGIPNPRQALWIGQLEDFDAVDAMMERFRVQVLAVDANPERRAAKALWARFPGRVVLVEYAQAVRGEPPAIKIEWAELPGGAKLPYKVSVNRTEAIDAMMESIRDGRNRPLRDPPDGWFEQMRAPKRRTVVSPTSGNARRVYVSTGADDYAHAEVYGLVATELWRMQMQLRAQADATGERHLPDEEFGFRRVQLAGDEVVDEYDPALRGMGGM